MILAAWLAAAVLVVGIEKASDSTERQVRRDCMADAMSYCKSSIPLGRVAIITCMRQNELKLRPVCRRHIRE